MNRDREPELDSLQPVEGPTRRHGLVTLAAIGMVAFLGLALGVAVARPSSPSATQAASALGSTAFAPGGSTAAPTAATPASSTAPSPVTPRATSPAPWAWTREALIPDVPALHATSIWPLDERFLVLAEQNLPSGAHRGYVVALLNPGETWRAAETPGAFEYLTGGTVIEGRLWMIALVRGVSEDDQTWQLVSTDDGQAWESLGPAVSLGPLEYVDFIGRRGSTWIASANDVVSDPDDYFNDTDARLLWSTDGIRWQRATLPKFEGEPSYERYATLGDTSIILGTEHDENGIPTHFVLTSSDGIAWRRAQFELPESVPPTFLRASGLACNEARCVITARPDNGGIGGFAITSEDGEQWDGHPIELGGELGTGQLHLVATDSGFLALGEGGWYALLTADGTSWRAVQVLPSASSDTLWGMAVVGDTVIALSGGSDAEPIVWRGRLSFLEEALDAPE